MREPDTIQPPPPPRPSAVAVAYLALWVQCTPDRDMAGAVFDLANVASLTLGRGRDVTYPFRDSWLSRCHVRLTVAAGQDPAQPAWIVEDLGTANGTFLNGVRVQTARVREGDVLRLGATVLVLATGSVPADDLGLVGRSWALARVRDQVRSLASSARPVHLTGESGSGKEVVARALHRQSRRRGPFLAVNMATVVPSLAESQLFGHRRGAFSGATTDQAGAFDVAEGGTLLLDEVADTDSQVQAKLLRAVDTSEIHRIGDPRPHAVDVRLVTATHHDLARAVSAGQFRADLYWRVGHDTVLVPPLRDRNLDVVPLADHFLAESGAPSLADHAAEDTRSAWQVAQLVEHYLAYGWPGNVRELQAEVRGLARAVSHRRMMRVSGAMPPVDEVVSPRIRVVGAALDVPARRREDPDVTLQAPIPHEPLPADPVLAQRYADLLADPAALLRAIDDEAGGTIKIFAERAAAALRRSPESVRRRVYRTLGDAVAGLRDRAG